MKYNFTDSIESLASIACAQEFTDSHELVAVSNEFASKSKHRLTYFGKFTCEDTVTATVCRKCKRILTCKFCSQPIT